MEKIKLKSTVLIYSLNSKTITLRYCSELIHIEDESGDLSFFFSLLDGSHTAEDIKSDFAKKYSEQHSSIVYDYLKTMKELKLIEYVNQGTVLDDYTLQRCSRNYEFFNTMLTLEENKYTPQEKIATAKVCLLGCGGLGSHVLLELAALGVKDIIIVDFDTIELSNLNRQILYYEEDIGKKKVFTAKERINKFSPTMNVKAVELRISDSSEIEQVIKGSDLVICVADKPRNSIITWLNEACCKQNIPFINGGLDTRVATFYSVIPGATGCVECWRSSLASNSLRSQILNQDRQGK